MRKAYGKGSLHNVLLDKPLRVAPQLCAGEGNAGARLRCSLVGRGHLFLMLCAAKRPFQSIMHAVQKCRTEEVER
jgi:hypothetical protein